MAKRITDEERVENYFLLAEEPQAREMAEKIRLILRVRWGGNARAGSLLPKQPRKRGVKLKEPKEDTYSQRDL